MIFGSRKPVHAGPPWGMGPPVEMVAISRLFCSPTNPRRNDAAVSQVVASRRPFGESREGGR